MQKVLLHYHNCSRSAGWQVGDFPFELGGFFLFVCSSSLFFFFFFSFTTSVKSPNISQLQGFSHRVEKYLCAREGETHNNKKWSRTTESVSSFSFPWSQFSAAAIQLELTSAVCYEGIWMLTCSSLCLLVDKCKM